MSVRAYPDMKTAEGQPMAEFKARGIHKTEPTPGSKTQKRAGNLAQHKASHNYNR
jgi:hypothetical protein